jgi:putative redox protein
MELASQDAFSDVTTLDRIHSFSVDTVYEGRFRAVSQIRELVPMIHDEPVELGGEGEGPTPLETVLAAFNACSGMIINILRRQLKFDLRGATFKATGYVDVRRVEAKRLGIPWTEVTPLAEHFYKVEQLVRITTSETEERLLEFREGVERLCPMQSLFRDAKVPLEAVWQRDFSEKP